MLYQTYLTLVKLSHKQTHEQRENKEKLHILHT